MGQRVNATQVRTELGYAETTTATGGITTTVTDLTGLSVTVNVPSGATILIEGFIAQIYSSAAGDRGDLQIREGSTSLQFAYSRIDTGANGWGGAYVRLRLQPSAGSHTYKISLARGAGTGTITTYAAADAKSSIQVRIV